MTNVAPTIDAITTAAKRLERLTREDRPRRNLGRLSIVTFLALSHGR